MNTVTLVNKVVTLNSGRKELKTWIKGQQHVKIWSTDWYLFHSGKILGNCIYEFLNKNMEELYKLYKSGQFNSESEETEITINLKN